MKSLAQTCLAILLTGVTVHAQNSIADSVKVARTLTELLTICDAVNTSEQTSLNFHRAAPYIVYRGDDKSRMWNDFANYSNVHEKEVVDNICLRINGYVRQDKKYKLTGYQTATESEGQWHVIIVSFKIEGVEKQVAFAFLKIKGKFALGDIDH